MSKKIIVLDSLFVILIVCDIFVPMIMNTFMDRFRWWNTFYGMYFFPSLFLILVFEVIMLLVTLVGVIAGVKNGKKYTEKKVYQLAKRQVIMRFVQIPFYVTIFYVAFAAIFGFITIPITIAFAIIDVISIALTGLCSIAVYSGMRKKGFITSGEQVIYTLCGFIYCLDVLVALIAYIRAFIRKRRLGLDVVPQEVV